MSSETDVSGDDGGYVHDPAAFRDGDDDDAVAQAPPPDAEREFGWRGWTLVGIVVFSFLVAPLLIIYRPPQLPYWTALLALPMLPGLLLGAAAIWATTRP